MILLEKGQSALEYMMTYGWAILVIAIIGVVVWQMGILEIGKTINPGKSGFSQITPLDWSASKANNKIGLVLVNDAGTRLNLTSVAATMISGGTGNCPSDLVPPYSILPASTILVNLTCTITDDVSEYYRAEVTLDYTNPASGLTHSSVGKVWGSIE